MDPQPTNEKLHLLSLPRKEITYTIFFSFLLISSLAIFNYLSPFEAVSLLHASFLSQILPKTRKPSATTCDYSDGRWVKDGKFGARIYDESCPFLDPGFRCSQNGRKDHDYLDWRWQPRGCDLPRFDARNMLEWNRNGRIVFAGDSIGRNQWESLLCMLAQAVLNRSAIYEENGNPISKHKGYLSMRFQPYNLTVEYYRAPFLVHLGRPPQGSPKIVKGTVRVDELHWYSEKWAGANVLVFNVGHWWNEEKTVRSGYYFQENGKVNMTMQLMEAFYKSLRTWKLWAMQHIDLQRSHVFFRSYSPVHYMHGTWDDGGTCDAKKEPEINEKELQEEPEYNLYMADATDGIKNPRKAIFLNITYLSEFRTDGHPSRYREPGTPSDAPQDCSHWCLPGVPDTWNEILYAQLWSARSREES